MSLYQGTLPVEAVGLKLYRHVGDRLVACEKVVFTKGYAAVDTVLRRASLSGIVHVGGEIKDHFADVYVADGSWVDTVALDAKSYKALKNHWMRCKLEPSEKKQMAEYRALTGGRENG